MEVPEVPSPPLEYQQFVERRAMWNLLGATSSYDTMTWAEVEEAKVFADLEARHPHRFQQKSGGRG